MNINKDDNDEKVRNFYINFFVSGLRETHRRENRKGGRRGRFVSFLFYFLLSNLCSLCDKLERELGLLQWVPNIFQFGFLHEISYIVWI